MIHTYKGHNFSNFRDNILEYLDSDIDVENQPEYIEKLSSIFRDLLNSNNAENLERLDNLHLTYNDWETYQDAITNELLGIYNKLLYSFSESHNSNTSLVETDKAEVIEALYLTIYADLYEALLIETNDYYRAIYSKYVNKLQHFSTSLTSKSFKILTYLWFIIPKVAFDTHLKKRLDADILNTVQQLKENEEFVKNLVKTNEKLKTEVKAIEKALIEQKREFNFVGLSNGFITLKENKVEELKSEKNGYNFLIFSIFFLIAVKLLWMFYYISNQNYDQTVLIIVSISTVFLLFVILYFFRISLSNIKSLKSQILQIDLRLTLCQFIHNYNTDTATLRSEDMKESFDKFESVIFAPIMPTDEKMPSTFDGLEQITKIVSELKKS